MSDSYWLYKQGNHTHKNLFCIRTEKKEDILAIHGFNIMLKVKCSQWLCLLGVASSNFNLSMCVIIPGDDGL